MKHYYKGSAWRKLRLRRTRSLRKPSLRWASNPQLKSLRPQVKRRLLLQRTMRYFKRSSMVNARTLPSFVKRAFGLSPQLSVPVHNASSTSVSAVRYLSPSPTMVPRRGDGLRPKARQSTCKTSSEARSYAKQLWLPKVISLSWAISRRLNREYLRGFRITKICSRSSGQAVILTPRLVRRCLTYPDLVRNRTQTYGSLQKVRSWVAAMGLVGRHLQRNCLSDFLVHRPLGTRKTSQRSSA